MLTLFLCILAIIFHWINIILKHIYIYPLTLIKLKEKYNIYVKVLGVEILVN